MKNTFKLEVRKSSEGWVIDAVLWHNWGTGCASAWRWAFPPSEGAAIAAGRRVCKDVFLCSPVIVRRVLK